MSALKEVSDHDLREEFMARGLSDDDGHEEPDCNCSLGDFETDDLVSELVDRGLFDVERREVEDAYEALLRGTPDKALRILKSALYPNGEGDVIANRVKQDQRASENQKKVAA
jgi:hypothetical protein